MKLYVCYGTWTVGKPVHAHPCGEAHTAVVEAGYEPEVVRSYGLGVLPGVFNELTPGRRRVKELTGNYWVPALVTDDGEVIQSSPKIIEWAQTHPAGGSAEAARAGAASGGAKAGRAEARAAMRRSGTIADLEAWTDHGATWRPLELTDERVVVELCTCYGEPVDVLQGEDAELIEYVRQHRDD